MPTTMTRKAEPDQGAAPMTVTLDLSGLHRLKVEIEAAVAGYAALIDGWSDLTMEYYDQDGITPERVREMVAIIESMPSAAEPYAAFLAQARDDLVAQRTYLEAAADTARGIADAAEEADSVIEEIDDRLNDIDGVEYISPGEVAGYVADELAEMRAWLASRESGDGGEVEKSVRAPAATAWQRSEALAVMDEVEAAVEALDPTAIDPADAASRLGEVRGIVEGLKAVEIEGDAGANALGAWASGMLDLIDHRLAKAQALAQATA